ncbi:MAG TPA: hypothetical protein VK666_25955 [Chryseolinea sp.]|nr:hypothetical protein [Chryseolinea sp.]
MEYVKYYDSLFTPIMKQVLRNYKRFRPQYLASIDTVLRKEIKNMENLDQTPRRLLPNRKYVNQESKDSLWRSIKEVDSNNIQRFKEIEKKYGWPGIQVIGSNQTMGDFVEPATIIIHNNEKDNLYFLNSAYAKAVKGEASWHDPERIMLNLLFRFYEEGHIKLRHTFFSENNEIDEDRSYFQLKALADLIKTNPRYKIIFFCVRYDAETESDIQIYVKELDKIIKFLSSNGVPQDNISIDNQVRKVTDDGLGKYRVAFRRVKRVM